MRLTERQAQEQAVLAEPLRWTEMETDDQIAWAKRYAYTIDAFDPVHEQAKRAFANVYARYADRKGELKGVVLA